MKRRRVGLLGLRDIGPAAKDGIPAVVKVFKGDKDVNVRQSAVQCLAKIGAGNQALIGVLVPELGSNLQTEVIYSLEAVDKDWRKSPHVKPGLAEIIKQLSDKDHIRRRFAITALDHIGPAEGAIPALEKLLKVEKDTVVIRFAEVTLKSLRDKKK